GLQPRSKHKAQDAMAAAGSNPSWSKHLLRAILVALVALVFLHSASSQSHRDFASPGQQKREASGDLLTQIGRSLREMLENLLGLETMHLITE
uniref:Transmembrane protein 109 n=1 Tax=Jaculus jaculus TaxID=51337 RepID=A0A8C5L766_JACJA